MTTIVNPVIVNKANGATVAPRKPTYDELKAQVAKLEADIAAKANKPQGLKIVLRALGETFPQKQSDGSMAEVEGKGNIGVYGLGQFPVFLYPSQWEALLTQENVGTILTLCKAPGASRK